MSREKQIEEMAKDLAERSFFYNGGCLMNYSHTAKLLYEAGYRKQEWISVEERLPRDTGEPEEYIVMLEHAHSPTVAMFYGGMFEKSAFCKCTVLGSKVTHWMPLPEPPKKEENET